MIFSPETLSTFFSLYISTRSIFGVALTLFVLYSATLLYHWFRYALMSPLTWAFIILYFGVSAVLLGIMLTVAIAL
jgi:hypothetical protein